MDIGRQIREFRIMKGYTVNKLANLAGISQSYLRDLELGKKNPTVETLSYICEALSISLADFFIEYCKTEHSVDSLTREIFRLTNQQRQALEAFLHSMLSADDPPR